MLAVKVTTAHGPIWYGPFKTDREAERFASWLTKESEPATAEDVPFTTGLRSPVTALLDAFDRIYAIAAGRAINDLTRETTPAATEAPETTGPTKGQQ